MSHNVFHLKTGDLLPAIQVTLLDADGNPVDLSNIGDVRFHMAGRGIETLDAEAEVVDAAGGVVKYDWQEGDTDVAGTFRAEFEVTSAGKQTTFPNNGNIIVVIRQELA